MPGSSVDRLTAVCEAAVTAVRGLWPAGKSRVNRAYLPAVEPADLPLGEAGRVVWVYPLGVTDLGRVERDCQLTEYRFGVAVASRHDRPLDPAETDAAAGFAGAVFDALGDPEQRLPGLPDAVNETAELSLYDPDLLREAGAFVSDLVFTYRERLEV